MDLLFELIIDLILEGTVELGTNKKVPKWVRYPVLLLLLVFFILIFSLLYYFGFTLYKENKLISFVILVLTTVLLIGSIHGLRKKLNKK